MTCADVAPLVEAIAEGELVANPAVQAHLAECTECRSAMDRAARLERLLKTRPVSRPPAEFTSRVLGRIRRDRWRREQAIDISFNLAIAVLGAAIAGGAVFLLYAMGLAAVASSVVDLFAAAAAELVGRATPFFPVYGATTALVASALAIWWWAERDVSF